MSEFKKFVVKLISSFFFLGYFPYLAGTLASAVGLILIWFLRSSFLIYLLVTSLIIILGFITAGQAEIIFKRKDSRKIVIDEVAGIFLSFLSINLDFRSLFLGFFLFRILDGLKVFPAARWERFSGAKGVMLDDLVAGFYTNIILQLVFKFLT
jgi:phosphatidylglycerophosphatase A